jgi:hypothetical protein
LQADLERSGLAHRGDVAIDAVGIAAFVANFLHQPGNKATATKGVVADNQWEEIRIAALDGWQANVDMRLSGRVRQV